MTSTFEIFEAENRFSERVERAAGGEDIVITRWGEQAARLVPRQRPDVAREAAALAERIRRSRAGHRLGGRMSIRDLIDEGRR